MILFFTIEAAEITSSRNYPEGKRESSKQSFEIHSRGNSILESKNNLKSQERPGPFQ